MKTKSITKQISIITIALVAGTVILCWLLNSIFLEKYYKSMKTGQLENGFEQIDEKVSAKDASYDGAFQQDFENLCTSKNLNAIIISADGTVLCSSEGNNQRAVNQFMELLFGAMMNNARENLVENEDYTIQLINDKAIQSDFLVLFGTLGDGNFIMIRSALEGIRDSVVISNRFLLYIGLMAVAVSIVVVILVTKRVTRPILRLSDISKKMANLDFSEKYEHIGKSRTEIDELGDCVNTLSTSLEKTISELKTANNELMIDIEEKEKIDEMRKDFISNVSHELKTPLALVSGYAEGLKECVNDDPESRDFYCDVIMDEADKMTKMVGKLLTLNRLEFGGVTPILERFDLTEVVGCVINSNRILLEQANASVDFAADKPCFVWADAFEIEEVLTNFYTNAIHHVEENGIIRIRLEEKQDCVRCSVFNTGANIPESELDKIWDKFYKVDKARTREYGGSGIGLSIVKAIMDSFHRDCGCENKADGVEFWFELDSKC